MNRPSHRLTHLLAAVTLGLAAAGTAVPTHAAPATPSVQAQIHAQLAAHPGGVQINATEVAYDNGRFIITFARPAGVTVNVIIGDCPTGKFCFYDKPDYGYPRGALADCAWQDLNWYGWSDRTESAYFNKASGQIQFLDHAGGTSHTGDPVLWTLTVKQRGLATVPYPNRADHTQGTC